MKLEYHKSANIGDAINPIIFNNYLPDFFDDDDSTIFLGIGTILGLKMPRDDQKVIVFSSGFGDGAPLTYGKKPTIDKNYEILCVRGPLTAKALDLPKNSSVTDGAILLKNIQNIITSTKTNKIGFIPHVGSLDFFDSKDLITKLGFKFIDPRNEPVFVLNEIASCNRIIAEAMHGAIIADTYRIPWQPVKFYKTINEFKWKDYCASMNLEYKPLILTSLYSKQIISSKFEKFRTSKLMLNALTILYLIFQKLILYNLVKIKLRRVAKRNFLLSSAETLNFKHDELLKILDQFKTRYLK